MARFKGKNGLDLIPLMVERLRYAKEAFPENGGLGPPGIKDFNRWEMTKFGRIDDNGNAVMPKSQYPKPLLSTTGIVETFSALNFVSDAFLDMKKHLKRAYQIGVLTPDHPFLSDFAVRRAYESPIKGYDDYASGLFSVYNVSFLSDTALRSKIKNFGDYVHHFLDFTRTSSDLKPLSITGWHRSKNSSIYSSGLVIDIAGQDLSVDEFKDDFFISAPEFSYYFKLAKYYGFLVNKNAPFMLVADINSPVMKEYINNNGLPSRAGLIDQAYFRVYQYDIERIEALMIEYYNLYVQSAPFIKEVKFCPNGKPRHNVISRNQTNIQIVRQKYPPRFFLNFYIDLRNIEERQPFKKADIRRMKQKAGFFYKKYNPAAALDYINEQYRSLYAAKEGTLYHWKQQQKMKKKNK